MRNNKGFTLIELMIVIAIIAILAAGVIPLLMKETSVTLSSPEVVVEKSEKPIEDNLYKPKKHIGDYN